MSNVKKILQMTSLLFGMAILFCYIAWSLGYEGFIIVGDIQLPTWALYTICGVLLCIDLSLRTGFTLNIYSWKVLSYSVSLTIVSLIGSEFLPSIIFTGLVPTLVFVIAILKKKLGKWGFVRLGIYTAIILIYQWSISKFSVIDLDVHISAYQALRLSINGVLINLLFYSVGGEKYHANRLEQLVFPGRTGTDKSRNEVCQNDSKSAESVPVDKFEKWVLRSVIGVVQVIQWMFILWVCNLDNLFLDALVMTTSFICHGMIISKRRHLKPIILCTLVATAMFYFAARFTISFQYSQFFPIIIGLLLTYTVYRISYQFEQASIEKAEIELQRIKSLERQIDQAWQQLDNLS